ncbi:PAP2-domain-containing protein [Panus rudis PR-1116 ss-1]|nr:PAP2-domain-containing protein [Panus rudis PR-1116 ss-1]
MYAGQLLCEAFNYVLKHIIQEERPNLDLGDGYGFPSSHSQWMGYFASFLFCHFTFRHRFVSTGSRILDILRTIVLYWGIATVAGAVAYSRYHLTYHTARQVFWGFTIGIIFGTFYYSLVELIPARKPQSVLGRVKISLLSSPLFTWFRLRDSWDVWPDGGMEVQYGRWRAEWDAKRLGKDKKVS